MARRKLPNRFLPRLLSTGRIAAQVTRAAASRVVRRSEADERVLGEALFSELDRLKGLAMKVGQILSYMEVGLPDATRDQLAKLQQGAEPLDRDVIVAALEEALGQPVDTLFEDFADTPIAAASIGQVHRATLHGTPVAVKVRYPGIADTLASDFAQIGTLGKLASLGTAVDGVALVAELRERMLEECDYRNEARSQMQFAALLVDVPGLRVPTVIPERCAETVLTTAWCEGLSFAELQQRPQAERERAATSLARLPWTTLFEHGLLHADPHPGNFLFDGEDTVVLDFGCVKELDPEVVASFRRLVLSVLDRDRPNTRRAAIELGLAPRPERLDWDGMFAMFDWMFEPYLQASFRFTPEWWQRGQAFSRPGNRNLRHQGFPPAWLWIQRTLWGLHAVLMRLDVEIGLAELARTSIEPRT